jgi:hypothetical protein
MDQGQSVGEAAAQLAVKYNILQKAVQAGRLTLKKRGGLKRRSASPKHQK